MSPIYTILVFVCIFNAINAGYVATKTPREIRIEIAKTASEQCRQESGVSKGEVHDIFSKHEFPEGGKGEKFTICYFTNIGFVGDDTFQWDVIKQHLGALFGIDMQSLDVVEKNCKYDDSTNVNPEQILDLAECIETEIVKLMKTIREKRLAAEIAAASTCEDKNEIPRDEVVAFIHGHKLPEGERQKEYIACYVLATGLLNSDGTLNWEGLKARLTVINGTGKVKLEKIQETCKDAEKKDDKERYFDIVKCVITELSEEDEDDDSESSEEESDLF